MWLDKVDAIIERHACGDMQVPNPGIFWLFWGDTCFQLAHAGAARVVVVVVLPRESCPSSARFPFDTLRSWAVSMVEGSGMLASANC